jgi:hypothetical protein
MYSRLPAFVLGFHGCYHAVGERVLRGEVRLKSSQNDFDWLGHRIYFWENNPQRAMEYAREVQKRSANKISKPCVVGAVIDLGHCLNLLDSKALDLLKEAYGLLIKASEKERREIPKNRPVGHGRDLLLRNLDCAVVETLHAFMKMKNSHPYDSVRSVFVEGPELYPNAGFKAKNHIQICVRNQDCIKGYFRPLETNVTSCTL